MKKIAFLVVVSFLAACVAGCATDPTQRLLAQAVDRLNKGDAAQYVELVKKAYADDPKDVFVLNNMGVVSEMEGNLPQARAFYEQVIQRAGLVRIYATNSRSYSGRLLKDLAQDNLDRIGVKN